MSKKPVYYSELAKAKVSATRNVVVSQCSAGGFTIAQQLVAQEEGNRNTAVFLKGAIHIEDGRGLHELRDALNVALEKVEKEDSRRE